MFYVLLLLMLRSLTICGHGAVTHPRPRNAVDSDLAPWKSGVRKKGTHTHHNPPLINIKYPKPITLTLECMNPLTTLTQNLGTNTGANQAVRTMVSNTSADCVKRTYDVCPSSVLTNMFYINTEKTRPTHHNRTAVLLHDIHVGLQLVWQQRASLLLVQQRVHNRMPKV